jgi:hypothetical protein
MFDPHQSPSAWWLSLGCVSGLSIRRSMGPQQVGGIAMRVEWGRPTGAKDIDLPTYLDGTSARKLDANGAAKGTETSPDDCSAQLHLGVARGRRCRLLTVLPQPAARTRARAPASRRQKLRVAQALHTRNATRRADAAASRVRRQQLGARHGGPAMRCKSGGTPGIVTISKIGRRGLHVTSCRAPGPPWPRA